MSEYTATLNGFFVKVDKVGGGTVGRAYGQEDWTVSVLQGGVYILDNANIYTGMPKTHKQVARMAYEYASEQVDENL